MIYLSQKELTSPCVYLFDKEKIITYVGLGSRGMKRAFTFDSIENRTRAIKECNGLEIRYFDSEEAAREEETRLIHQHHPEGNRFCSLCDFYYKQNPAVFRKEGQLFGKTRNAILSLLLESPEKAYHVREISELTNTALSAAQRELKSLSKNGILRRFSQGGKVYHQAEDQHPIFTELRSLVSKGA